MATDREIGTAEGPLLPTKGVGPICEAQGETCWTRYQFAFETTRHAFRGEQLTFQVQLLGSRSTAFGFEGAHASKVTITPAPMPASGLEFGATITEPTEGQTVTEGMVVAGGRVAFPNLGTDPTGAGDHPTRKHVDVSVDDPSFGAPIEASLDEPSGTWSAPLGRLARGAHTIYVRAAVDRTYSDVVQRSFTVVPNAQVQWQIVDRNSAPSTTGWKPATGLENWSFSFNTGAYRKSWNGIVVRLVQEGQETARTSALARFK
jgi:hypothetical protein